MVRLGGLLACLLLPLVVGIAGSTLATVSTSASTSTAAGNNYQTTTANDVANAVQKPDIQKQGKEENANHSSTSASKPQEASDELRAFHPRLKRPGSQITSQGLFGETIEVTATDSTRETQGLTSSLNGNLEGGETERSGETTYVPAVTTTGNSTRNTKDETLSLINKPLEKDSKRIGDGQEREHINEKDQEGSFGLSKSSDLSEASPHTNDWQGVRRTRDISSSVKNSEAIHQGQTLPGDKTDVAFEEEIKEWGRWDEREAKKQKGLKGKRRRHRLRHGKRRHERGDRELLDTDFSFGSFDFAGSSIVEENHDKRNVLLNFPTTSQPANNIGGRNTRPPSIRSFIVTSKKHHLLSTATALKKQDVEITSQKTNQKNHPSISEYPSIITHLSVSQKPSKRPLSKSEIPWVHSKSRRFSKDPKRELSQHAIARLTSSAMNGGVNQQENERSDPTHDYWHSHHLEQDHRKHIVHDKEILHLKHHNDLNNGTKYSPFTKVLQDNEYHLATSTVTQKPRESGDKHSKASMHQSVMTESDMPNAALQNSELFIDREKFKISISKNYSTQQEANYATVGPAISTELNDRFVHKNNGMNEKKDKSGTAASIVNFPSHNSVPSLAADKGVLVNTFSSQSPAQNTHEMKSSNARAPGNDKPVEDLHLSHYVASKPSPPLPPPPPSSPPSFSPSPLPPPAPSISPLPPWPSAHMKGFDQLNYPPLTMSTSSRVERVSERQLPTGVFFQTLPRSPPSGMSSSSQVLMSNEALTKSQPPSEVVTAAALTAAGSCYSTNDIIVVIFLTSLVNMVVFLVVTLGLCWCSLRGRMATAAPRTIRADDQRSDDNDEEAEMIPSSEGCLEACLPDISYQRHIARGAGLTPAFVMGRALRPLVNPNHPPRLSHAVHELLHNLTNSPDYQQHKRKLSKTNRRSLSLENLALT